MSYSHAQFYSVNRLSYRIAGLFCEELIFAKFTNLTMLAKLYVHAKAW